MRRPPRTKNTVVAPVAGGVNKNAARVFTHAASPKGQDVRTLGRGSAVVNEIMGVDAYGAWAYKRVMPAPANDDQKSFNRKLVVDSGGALVPEPPKLPEDVKKRFPSLVAWERQMKDWAQKQLGQSQ